jgi:hypothetical protein
MKFITRELHPKMWDHSGLQDDSLDMEWRQASDARPCLATRASGSGPPWLGRHSGQMTTGDIGLVPGCRTPAAFARHDGGWKLNR